MVKRINQKLSPRFYGPFRIIARVGQTAYKLQLPDSSKIHNVFHVSLLKRAVGNSVVEPTLPPGLEMDDKTAAQPEKVLSTRSIMVNGNSTQQWLVQWLGETAEEATWEDSYTIQSQFPEFRLEDKPIHQLVGIDKESAIGPVIIDQPSGSNEWKVYKRKKWRGTRVGLNGMESVTDVG